MRSDYDYDICIIGLGPAGIGAALALSGSNITFKVLCLDAGPPIDKRHCPVLQSGVCEKEKPCSMVSGIGGASLLSGHKISTFPAGSKIGSIVGSKDLANKKLTEALKILKDYLPLQEPEISEKNIKIAEEMFKRKGFVFRYFDSYMCDQEALKKAYENILSKLRSKGIVLLSNSEMVDLIYNDKYFNLIIQQNSRTCTISCKYLIIGVGRLGHKIINAINRKFNLGGTENNLEIGVRLEFPSEIFPDIDRYHKDLKLLYNNFRTFCVCKGGKLAPYYLEDIFLLDGFYDLTNKTNFTNLGIMLRLKPSGQNNRILYEIKKRIIQASNGKPIRQMLIDYLNLKSGNKAHLLHTGNSISYWVNGDISKCFPEPFSSTLKEGVHKFVSTYLSKNNWNKVSVFAPAIEYNCLRFPMNSDFSILPRMYLIGDCTGQFRGILQAFCSGIICTDSIIGDAYEKKILYE